jgi:hypothetical protein
MGKPSPGPWIVADIIGGPYVVCANNYAIAQIVKMPGEFAEERSANARVMAAAWELLDAAKYLSEIEAAALKRGYDALDAAIAKAEGRET